MTQANTKDKPNTSLNSDQIGGLNEENYRQMDIQTQDDSRFGQMKAGLGADEAEDRIGFIRKVYGILSLQLLITGLMTIIPLVNEAAKLWIAANIWLVWVTLIAALVVECAIICVKSLARTVPTNYILLFTFTVCEAYLVMFIAAFSDPTIVCVAALFTVGITVALTIYAFQTKRDFTYGNAAIAILIAVFLILGIVTIFIKTPWLINLYCCLGVIIFGFYLVYDTQLLIGGGRYELSQEDYIIASLIIYLDIIMIFIYILELLSDKR